MTEIPDSFADNLDGHRNAIALQLFLLTNQPKAVGELLMPLTEDERLDLVIALATQAAGYLHGMHDGDPEPGAEWLRGLLTRFASMTTRTDVAALVVDLAPDPEAELATQAEEQRNADAERLLRSLRDPEDLPPAA
jgi:hypothetical protein